MALSELSNAVTDDLSTDELRPGTVLFHDQYTITRYMNSGGFGITYLAKDSLDRDVVIKECFASSLCRRHRTQVSARSSGSKEDLKKVIRYFLKEARSLSRLDHPNIVRVHQVFEDNGTAYMALDYIRGHDLLDVIEGGYNKLTPAAIVIITRKLVSAIDHTHKADIMHGDISPDNIFLSEDNEPILIDFGAARKCMADTGSKYSGLSVVKDGYSPHELYFAGGNYGPWSDLYALAASMYHAVTGAAPPSSQSRLSAIVEHKPDPCIPLAGRFRGYPAGFLESLDKAMGVMPKARFQSADEWLDVLDGAHGQADGNVKLLRKALRVHDRIRADNTPPTAHQLKAVAETGIVEQPKTSVGAIDLSGLAGIGGFIGGCLVDSDTGLMMASEGGAGVDLEVASAANAAVVKAKFRAIRHLGLNDRIDDILVSLGTQLHLLRPLEKQPALFIYVALDRKVANLGLARMQVRAVEQAILV
jgi:serine/threonine protein kinase/predicted regulator of Ras-like GTPase activity (Roadblock/LC7/MglB family)